MTPNTSKKYSRIAKLYDMLEYPIERVLFQKLRVEALSYAQKMTLEVGVGTGKNLPYYNPEIGLIAIDFSPGMLKIAQEKLHSVQVRYLRLWEMDVQQLAFANGSFDTIVSTFVFCTVPEPLAGLQELYRVLKPSGKAIFLEHMKSHHGLVNIPLYLMNVFSTRLLGTSMIRETQKNIELAGFTIESVKYKALGIVRLIIARKDPSSQQSSVVHEGHVTENSI
jgi:ubiquinone/menaquinone biosynthesis C-methylase UbiE